MNSARPGHTLQGQASGTSWVLKSIEGPALLVERLYEIGFLPGETIHLHGRTALGGPWLVEVRGTTVALRENEVQCLQV